MRQFNFGASAYFCQKEDLPDLRPSQTQLEYRAQDLLARQMFRNVIDSYRRLTSQSGVALLHVHGGSRDNQWCFKDNGKIVRMQDWIDSIDGLYSAILVYACNPKNHQVESNRSIVVHATDTFRAFDFMQRRVRLRLYAPGIGYVENDYRRMHALCSAAEF